MNIIGHEKSEVDTTTLAIVGMTCGACERHVMRALQGLSGVIHVTVDLQDAQATVEHRPALVDAMSLVTAVRDAGYEARTIETIADANAIAPGRTSRTACGCGCCGPSGRAND